jgi:hypothetical protein
VAKAHASESRHSITHDESSPQNTLVQSVAPLQSIWHEFPAVHVTLQSTAPAQPMMHTARSPQVTSQSVAS